MSHQNEILRSLKFSMFGPTYFQYFLVPPQKRHRLRELMQYGKDSMYILQWFVIHERNVGNFSRVQRKKTDVDYSVGIP